MRRENIRVAFDNAMIIEQNGRRIVRTSDFVRALHALNISWSRERANEWIDYHQPGWRDCSTEEGNNRTYFLMNMCRTM